MKRESGKKMRKREGRLRMVEEERRVGKSWKWWGGKEIKRR